MKNVITAYVSAPGFRRVDDVFIHFNFENDSQESVAIKDINIAKELRRSLDEWIDAWETGGDATEYGQSGHKGRGFR